MKCEATTEAEMRDCDEPSPKTADELDGYIASLVEREHDYGTCVYAMSLAATAAFNYVAGKLGVTGFQACCADLDVVRRTRRLKGPFMLIKGEDMLYPQHSLQGKLREAMDEWADWASDEAKKLLAERHEHAHPDVVAHWRALAERKP